MGSYTEFAHILGIPEDVLKRTDIYLSHRFGKENVIHSLVKEIRGKIHSRLEILGVRHNRAHLIHSALLKKMKRDDHALFEYFGSPLCDTDESCREVIATAREISNVDKGYFLREEKARELLERNPPKHTLSFFKLRNVTELLNRFDLFEVYSSLRFIEDREWLNTVFFKQIEYVIPEDFEERPIRVRVLHKDWMGAAEEKFIGKKFHNISHLKELGIIFVIPLPVDTPGEIMRLFSLILHYLHEIDFYSKLFKRYAYESESFAKHVVSSLRGDVIEKPFSESAQPHQWMMIQRYLAKENESDPRLFVTHVNPEALHWTRAEDDIARLGRREKKLGLDFWHNLDYIGAYFPDELGSERFTSFNLVDNAMSLISNTSIVKYSYHHREALWNKLFSSYVGQAAMEKMIIDNFMRGYIEL